MAWTEMASSEETNTDGAGTIRTMTTKTYAKASGAGYLVRVDKLLEFEYNSDGIAGLEMYYGMPATSLVFCFDTGGSLALPASIDWTLTETDTVLNGETQTVRGKTYEGQPRSSAPANLPGKIHRQERSMEDVNAIPMAGSIGLAWEKP